jgi:hypothetical protein
VQSGKFTKKRRPAFACLVYYHKLDGDTLHKIKNQYVGPLRQRYETEIRGIEGIRAASRTEAQEQRFRELEGLITELKAFGRPSPTSRRTGFRARRLRRSRRASPSIPGAPSTANGRPLSTARPSCGRRRVTSRTSTTACG